MAETVTTSIHHWFPLNQHKNTKFNRIQQSFFDYSLILRDSIRNHHHRINFLAIQSASSSLKRDELKHWSRGSSEEKEEGKKQNLRNLDRWSKQKNQESSENNRIKFSQRFPPLKVSTKTLGKTQNLFSENNHSLNLQNRARNRSKNFQNSKRKP